MDQSPLQLHVDIDCLMPQLELAHLPTQGRRKFPLVGDQRILLSDEYFRRTRGATEHRKKREQ